MARPGTITTTLTMAEGSDVKEVIKQFNRLLEVIGISSKPVITVNATDGEDLDFSEFTFIGDTGELFVHEAGNITGSDWTNPSTGSVKKGRFGTVLLRINNVTGVTLVIHEGGQQTYMTAAEALTAVPARGADDVGVCVFLIAAAVGDDFTIGTDDWSTVSLFAVEPAIVIVGSAGLPKIEARISARITADPEDEKSPKEVSFIADQTGRIIGR